MRNRGHGPRGRGGRPDGGNRGRVRFFEDSGARGGNFESFYKRDNQFIMHCIMRQDDSYRFTIRAYHDNKNTSVLLEPDFAEQLKKFGAVLEDFEEDRNFVFFDALLKESDFKKAIKFYRDMLHIKVVNKLTDFEGYSFAVSFRFGIKKFEANADEAAEDFEEDKAKLGEE